MDFAVIYQTAFDDKTQTVTAKRLWGKEERTMGSWKLPYTNYAGVGYFHITQAQEGLLFEVELNDSIAVYYGSFTTGKLSLLAEIDTQPNVDYSVYYVEGYCSVGIWIATTAPTDAKATYWLYALRKEPVLFSRDTLDLDKYALQANVRDTWIVPVVLTNENTLVLLDLNAMQILVQPLGSTKFSRIPLGVSPRNDISVINTTSRYIFLLANRDDTLLRIDYLTGEVVTVPDMLVTYGCLVGHVPPLYTPTANIPSLHDSRMVIIGKGNEITVLLALNGLRLETMCVLPELEYGIREVFADLFLLQPNYFRSKTRVAETVQLLTALTKGGRVQVLATPPPYYSLPMYPRELEQVINSYL